VPIFSLPEKFIALQSPKRIHQMSGLSIPEKSSSVKDPFFQTLFADRIGGSRYGKSTEIYKFEKIKRAKRKALSDFPDRPLIDFGIGENDSMADPTVRAALAEAIDRPENRGYADNGIAEYKQAVARFMQRRFGVSLDPIKEINHCIGSKTALAMLPACFINPGDITLMTVPGYPVAGTHSKYYGGQVVTLPLLPENDFFPDFDSIDAETWRRTKILVLNYPNSPTGKTATAAFFERVVELAHQQQFVVIQDAAHVMLSYDSQPLSFLSVPGAKDVGLEVHSMSKGFNMIGWRIGWVCGHATLVSALADVKDNSDSGQFMAIQQAAAVALDNDSIADGVRSKYQRRLEKLVQALRQSGFDCQMPGGTYFLYTKSPVAAGGQKFSTAEQASQALIEQQSIVTVPWDEAGPHLRFSVTYEAADEAAEDQLMVETQKRLSEMNLVFEN
jgi:LL-diaminopimelate aminotransferase